MIIISHWAHFYSATAQLSSTPQYCMFSGNNIRYEGFNPDVLRQQSEDMALMYEWFNKSGYTANINELKKYGFLTYKDWAEKQDWKL